MDEFSIAALWASYERDVMPEDADVHQRMGTKMAFYGGASALLATMKAIADTVEEEGQAALMFEAFESECKAFAANIEAEYLQALDDRDASKH